MTPFSHRFPHNIISKIMGHCNENVFVMIGLFPKSIHAVTSTKPLKEKISITLDGDTLQKIKEKAEAEDRSLSQYINLVLRRHLQAQDTEHCEKK